MTLVAGTLVVLTLLLAPYLKPWLEQRAQVAATRAEVASLRGQVADLQREQARWDDPQFVKAQARGRLNFVMPGETGYVVLDDRPVTSRPVDAARRAAQVPAAVRPWYGDLWASVVIAGDEATSRRPGSP